MPLIPQHEGPAHYPMSPSSAKRWIACPGSRLLVKPSPRSAAIIRGDHLHAAAADLLNPDRPPPAIAPNNLAFIQPYVSYCQQQPGYHYTEQKMVHPTIGDFGGTVDHLIHHEEQLEIVDLKTGKWPVKATGNMQLLSYLVIASTVFPDATLFKGTIVQPQRLAKPDSWAVSRMTLDRFQADVVASYFRRDLVAGPHCTDSLCPLRKTCKPYKQWRNTHV